MSVNRNAFSAAFGWEFQVNAAIVLFIRNIENADSVCVEGEKEDIEISLSNGEVIYSQVKANTGPEPGKNSTTRFYDALTTLKESAEEKNCSQIIFITNDDYPLGKNNDFSSFHGGCFLGFEELPATLQGFTRESALQHGMTDEDLEKFSIMVIGFFGKDPETRHKVIRQRVKDFIDGLRISSYSGVNDGNLRDQWGLLFHENAANSDLSITISKQEFIWPIIVALCNNGRRGYTIDGYDQSYVEEIMEEYDSVINYQKSRYELVTRITTAFDRYVIDSKAHRRSTEHNGFVNSSWQDYVEDFGLNILHDLEEREIVTKVIMLSILRREKVIKDIKKGVNLED